MQRNNKHFFWRSVIAFLLFGLLFTTVYAAAPLWVFEPQTPVTVTIAKGSSAQITYKVTNLSSKTKNLVMKPIAGVTQASPCVLLPKGSCTLALNVNGSTLRGDVLGGPVLCQQGSDLQCYQPNPASVLRIYLTKEPPVQQFTVTPSAGAGGSISPSTPQIVNSGGSLAFTAIPNSGFTVNEWLVDGNVVQSGGMAYQLSNIRANHTVQVTFLQTTTLSALTLNLTLSINSPSADPALPGNPRSIQITNVGSAPAIGVQVSNSAFPAGTAITSNTCTGTLNAGATCNITITPGSTASSNVSSIACTASPGTEPVSTTVTISADNALPTSVNVLILGYGCIYQGGYLFSVDDSPPSTQNIGGKVAMLLNDGTINWGPVGNVTGAVSTTDGAANTSVLTPIANYPAAEICVNKNDQGYTDWYLPAICELGRYVGLGTDAGCGTTNPNLYTTLHLNGLGNFDGIAYWSSSQSTVSPANQAWAQFFSTGSQIMGTKGNFASVKCVRSFAP